MNDLTYSFQYKHQNVFLILDRICLKVLKFPKNFHDFEDYFLMNKLLPLYPYNLILGYLKINISIQ